MNRQECDPGAAVVEPGFEDLCEVLMEALDQSQHGKGAVRHGRKRAFSEQPIFAIPELLGDRFGGFTRGQAVKKIVESAGLEPEHAAQELLGAIVYLAASIIALRETSGRVPRGDAS